MWSKKKKMRRKDDMVIDELMSMIERKKRYEIRERVREVEREYRRKGTDALAKWRIHTSGAHRS